MNMSVLKSAGKSTGIAIGRIQKLTRGRIPIPEKNIQPHQVEDEIQRLKQSIKYSLDELNIECEQLEQLEILDPLLILEVHRMLLTDPELTEKTIDSIAQNLVNAEWALRQQIDRIKMVFAAIEDPYLRERSDDIEQVGARIIRHLQGHVPKHELISGTSDTILIADDFNPVDVVKFWRQGAAGLIAEQGGMNAHNIIVARGIGLPMLVGVNDILSQARDGDMMILDAELGTWTINPQAQDIRKYELFRNALHIIEQDLQAYATRPSTSEDGHAMALMANLEFLDEVAMLQQVGAEGIGLFRSEFMFMNAQQLPDAAAQAQCYKRLIQATNGGPVTIRLLDIGGDKPVLFREIAGHEYAGANPALGLRGIRLLRQWPEILQHQLTGILLASQSGPVQLLVPMVASTEEVELVRNMCEQICRQQGLNFNSRIGTMMEVPAAVMIADELAKVSDFFSVGTNDLIQYTLATDRSDEEADHIYGAKHPAILKMLELTVRAAKQQGIPVTVCGELASDDNWTETFLNLDIDALSMSTHNILPIRKHLAKLRYQPRRLSDS